jgi:hypothetical protein
MCGTTSNLVLQHLEDSPDEMISEGYPHFCLEKSKGKTNKNVPVREGSIEFIKLNW